MKNVKSLFDMGAAWARKRFAKPSFTGSIPAHVSIFMPMYGRAIWSRGHRYQLGQRFGRWIAPRLGAFLSGVAHGLSWQRYLSVRPMSEARAEMLMMEKHEKLSNALIELDNLRVKHIATSKELSRLKREHAIQAREEISASKRGRQSN